MEADGPTPEGRAHPPGYWGKWRGVQCAADDCEEPAKCKGLCTSHYNKMRWAAGHGRLSPEQTRRAHLRYRYGMDVEHYERMLDSQGGVCAICERPPTDENTRGRGVLFVDHDHDSDRVRALLCNDCNLIIGHGATVDRLVRATEYLRLHGGPDRLD